MIVVKTILSISFLAVFYQDIKDRNVYWFLFLIIAISCGWLHFKNTLTEFFISSLIINLAFVLVMFLVIFLYSKFKLKVNPQDTFGLGDTLMFIALSFSFSSISFVLLFVFSLIFSLLLHLVFKNRSKFKTVPLAGYMSLFFMMIYLFYWLGFNQSLYLI